MNPLARRFGPLLLGAILLAGCGKKKIAATETAKPASTVEAAPQAVHPKSAEPEAAPPGPLSPLSPADLDTIAVRNAAPDEVSDKLLVTDQAYAAWFKKHGLDLNDPKMLDADSDGDGASNRDEFLADTDPRDPKSRPGIHQELRLKEYSEVRVPLMLESVAGKSAKIRRLEENGKTESVTVGQSVGGMKVEKIVVRHETDKNGQPVDLSRVDLEDSSTRSKVVLVKDMPARSAESYALLTSPGHPIPLKVHQGGEFHWPPDNSGKLYKVVDMRADQIVVQEVATQRVWTIIK